MEAANSNMIEIITKCNVKKLGERKSSNDQVDRSSFRRPRVDRINVYFRRDTVIREWSNNVNLVRTTPPCRMVNSVHIIDPPLTTYAILHEAIEKQLINEWDLSGNSLERLIKTVVDSIYEMLKSVSPKNDVLDVYVEIGVNLDHYLPRNHFGMIQATESSIESLERKIIRDCDNDENTCSICMVDFSKDCEVVCMPCSVHVFHGDCIEKWLRISHYCPMCCYEMPTSIL